ncbi:hypothetical protein [Desulfocicer niacini]
METNDLKIGIFVLIAVVCLCLTGSPVFAFFGGKIKHFTADNVSMDPNGKVVHSGKVYVSDGDMHKKRSLK